ncbi:MAG: hypothetical protein OHK0057_13540 [Thermoflexibacter sp.]
MGKRHHEILPTQMGLAKPLFKDILPKIFRKNRLKSYSVFHIGKEIIDFCIENDTCFLRNFAKL